MKILTFPELRQTFNYDCGASVLQSVLTYFGIERREDKLIREAKTSPATGTTPRQILHTLHRYHLKTRAKQMTITEVKRYIDRGYPVIMVLQAWTNNPTVDWKSDWQDGHYVVAIGYDRHRIYFEDPSTFERDYLTYTELNDRWHDGTPGHRVYRHYGMAVFGQTPRFNPQQWVHME